MSGKGNEMTQNEIEIWNRAIRACQQRVISDGVQLHPELVALLEPLIKTVMS